VEKRANPGTAYGSQSVSLHMMIIVADIEG